LLLLFQGMIAEYERAQILERPRRGKRHPARQGQVSILSGAPHGYHYVRKTDEAAAHYQVIEAEVDVVRRVYQRYTVEHLSIQRHRTAAQRTGRANTQPGAAVPWCGLF
jgi:site-specific DNA recombinase